MKHPNPMDPAEHLRELTRQLNELIKSGKTKPRPPEARTTAKKPRPKKPPL